MTDDKGITQVGITSGPLRAWVSVLQGCSMLVLALGVAPAARADRIDDYVREQMEKRHIPGLSLAVVENGKLVRAKGYGFADLELQVRAKPETVYQIQSITKSFTATGVMLLVQEGKIRLEDPPHRYLTGLPEAWKDVTVRHLLNHTSGIKDFINEPTVDLRKEIAEAEVIRSLEKLPLNFPTGERYAYSNTNYHLLGMIVRKVTGKNWGEFLRERIFEPLGMRDTRVLDLDQIIQHRAAGYLWDGKQYRNGGFVAESILAYAGGGIRSTVLDLARWDAALASGRLLKREVLEQMWTPGRLNNGAETGYGLGWGVSRQRGSRVVGHAGAHYTGFHTDFTCYPDDGLTVIVLANRFGCDPGLIARGVAGLLRKNLRPPHALVPRKDPDPRRTEHVLAALREVGNGDLPAHWLTPEFARTLSPEARQLTAQRLEGRKAFEFLGEDDLSRREVKLYGVPVVRQVYYRLSTAGENRYYTCALTADGKCAAITSYRD